MNQTITKDLIRRLAGDRYFERGVNYFRQGRVAELEDFGDSVEAIVEGTEEYVVKLTAKSGDLEHDCNCPLGLDEEFCKHCVAVALAWLDAQSTAVPQKPGGPKKAANSTKITAEDIAGALDAADKATLVKLLLQWSEDSAELREKLTQIAARRKGPEAGIALARKTLEKAIRIRGFVDCREARTYAAGVEAAIDLVEELFRSGQAVGVIDLCETGVRLLSTAIEQIDDSDGYMTMLLERLQDLHLRACAAAKPDATLLARKLFQAEMSGGFGEWSNAAEKYAEVLGEEGLAAYRRLAEAAWAKVPEKTERGRDSGSVSHFAITRIMEALARQSGNLDDLVAVLERDLSYANQYLRIAGLYRKAGGHEKALAWAERGMKAVTGYEGAALRIFVAEEYRHNDRHADALRIIWIEFRDSPGLETYKRLEEFARAAEDWDEWRGQALAHVRKTLAGDQHKSRGNATAFVQSWRFRKRDRSLLVEIFLYERKADEAWAEAQAGGCGDTLWLHLAQLREKQHPADAAAIYLRLADQDILQATGNYDSGVALLERAAAAARSAGESAKYETEFDVLLKKYKAKRNLQKLVANRRRFLYLGAQAQ
ncbi:MAG: DUF6880 family protein [Terracidiphilus sp.]